MIPTPKQTLENLVQQAKKTLEPKPQAKQERDLAARLPIAVVSHLERTAANDFWYLLAYSGAYTMLMFLLGMAGWAAGRPVLALEAGACAAAFFGVVVPFGNFACVKTSQARRRRFLIAYGLLPQPAQPVPDMVTA